MADIDNFLLQFSLLEHFQQLLATPCTARRPGSLGAGTTSGRVGRVRLKRVQARLRQVSACLHAPTRTGACRTGVHAVPCSVSPAVDSAAAALDLRAGHTGHDCSLHVVLSTLDLLALRTLLAL